MTAWRLAITNFPVAITCGSSAVDIEQVDKRERGSLDASFDGPAHAGSAQEQPVCGGGQNGKSNSDMNSILSQLPQNYCHGGLLRRN